VINVRFEKGNTVRLEVEFLGFEDVPVDPDNITFKVYDIKYTELQSNELNESNKIRDADGNPIIGRFYYDYIPQQIGGFYIEFLGYIDNKPTLKRERIDVIFDG
jgi:hypothetical protein